MIPMGPCDSGPFSKWRRLPFAQAETRLILQEIIRRQAPNGFEAEAHGFGAVSWVAGSGLDPVWRDVMIGDLEIFGKWRLVKYDGDSTSTVGCWMYSIVSASASLRVMFFFCEGGHP